LNTEIFREPYDFERAARIIRDGGLVAFPTETVYGLGADGFNAEAVRKIFEVKGRANDNPLILHVSDLGELLGLTAVGCHLSGRPRSSAPTVDNSIEGWSSAVGTPETASPTVNVSLRSAGEHSSPLRADGSSAKSERIISAPTVNAGLRSAGEHSSPLRMNGSSAKSGRIISAPTNEWKLCEDGMPRTASPTTTTSPQAAPPLRRRGIVQTQAIIERLYEAFMPGALTLVVPKSANIPDAVTCGLETVAVRVPSHPIAREFIKACGVPIAAPSANLSGKPSCTTFDHVFHDMNGKIEGIIDGGGCDIGLESTILDLSVEVPTILRLGGVSVEAIREVIGEIEVANGGAEKPKAPGMKYRHYAPEAPLYIVDDIDVEAEKYEGKRIGKLYASEDLEKYANELFDNLRKFDNEKVDVILVEKMPNIGIGMAINNRLEKAAKGK